MRSFWRWVVPACGLVLLGIYGWYDWGDPRRPHAAALTDGWWTFSDQGRYLTDTVAWAAGDLASARHYYLPGYALLGAPFVHLTPANPFLLPDAALLVVCLWLAAGLSAALLPGWRWARAVGAVAFTAVAAIPAATEVWVTPWTTTPAAALTLGCLLALLRFLRQPGSWRTALAASLCASCILAFRPTDGALLLAITALTGAVALLAARPGWRAALAVAAAAAAGAIGPAVGTVLLYVAEHGWQLSPYLELSAYLGFEWRMLPLQWVTLVLSPQPMLPDGDGMLSVFPFIATGLAGMAACLAAPPRGGTRGGHAVVIGAVVAYGALYLCYRDLHPPGFWRFYNYHYFKWLLPVFASYTVFLLLALPRWPAAVAAVAVLAAILPWRAHPVPLAVAIAAPPPGHILPIPAGMDMRTGLLAGASGGFEAIYNGTHNYYFGDSDRYWYGSIGRIAAYAVPGGLLLDPVHDIAAGPGHVRLDPGVTLDPTVHPRLIRFALSYGRPCLLPKWLGGGGEACQFASALAVPIRAVGVPIPFDATVDEILTPAWSAASVPGSRWTEGSRAGLHLRLDPAPTDGVTLAVAATAFIPEGSDPMDVTVEAGGRRVGQWHLIDADPHTLRMALPAAAFEADGGLRLVFQIANPRRPSVWLPLSDDARLLGLRVQSVTFEGP